MVASTLATDALALTAIALPLPSAPTLSMKYSAA